MGQDKLIQELSANYGDWWKKGFDAPKMTNDLYPYDSMFSPIRVNRMTIKNRLVMAPMGWTRASPAAAALASW